MPCHHRTGNQPDLRVTSMMRSVREGERRWRKPRLGPGATTDKTGLCVRAPLAQTRSGLGSQGLAKTAEALAAIMYEAVRGRTRAEVASTLHTVSPGRNQYSCLKTEKKKSGLEEKHSLVYCQSFSNGTCSHPRCVK